MNKNELFEIIKSLQIPFNEGENSVANSNKYPRIVIFDYLWNWKKASNNSYLKVEINQISFFSKEPRPEKLQELINKLHDKKLDFSVNCEFVNEKETGKKYFHYFFSLELVTDE